MARDLKVAILLPISICVSFFLAQCLLQRHTQRSQEIVAGSFTPKRRFEPGSRSHYISRVWKVLIGSQKEGFNKTSLRDGTLIFPQAIDEKERKYWMSLYEPEDEVEESERLRKSPYIYHEEEERKRLESPLKQTEMKYISFYQPWDKTQKSFKMCRYQRCAYADKFSKAHVVAFKASFVRDHGVPSFYRPRYQRWILFTSDPASKNYGLDREEVRSKFNATCTYRLNADISWMFGLLRKIPPLPEDYDKIYEAKDRPVAWYVSHCQTHSRREEYVKRMQKVIPVDIYGLCNNVSCGNYNHRKDFTTPCLPLLSEKYMFYLSFENSFCEDYVTEKFFKLFHNINIIPVVRGGIQYSKYFPSDIFIDTADFDSPEELARYLLYLTNDKKRYLQMLRKKKRWTLTPAGEAKHCKLCEYAHTKTDEKIYPNLKEAFNGDYPHCWYPKDIESPSARIH